MLQIGDKITITDIISPHYGQIGTVKDVYPKGSIDVIFEDGLTEFRPWGWQRIRTEDECPKPE